MQEEHLNSLPDRIVPACKQRSKLLSRSLISFAVAGALAAASTPSMAAVADFIFDTQAVGNATPEDPVATLHLEDLGGGVQFTLTPNGTRVQVLGRR